MDRTGIGLLLVYLLCVSVGVLGQGRVNIALGKTYSQISLYDNTRPASHAANGNTRGTYNEDNCIHTAVDINDNPSPNGEYHWWQVDLGRIFPVYDITVWARDTFNRRLYPFNITVDGQTCVTVPASEEPLFVRYKSVTCASVLYGQRVRITLRNYAETLNLCEFQIVVPSGVVQCPVGRYGAQCGQNCGSNCGGGPGKNFCVQNTGVCYAGCAGNFAGDTCTDCREGFYGSTYCTSPCRGTCVGGCDRITGHCTSCTAGHWGETCEHRCNQGCTNAGCAKDNGYCVGCTDGRWGDTCEKWCDWHCTNAGCDKNNGHCAGCDVGYWGSSFCRLSCPVNCAESYCQRANGHCNTCKPGVYGNQCDTRCDHNNRGCAQCTKQGVCTSCKTGYTGLPCTDCAPGYYKSGNLCYQCLVNCKNRQCDSNTGKCDECYYGFHGDQCGSRCSTIMSNHYTQCTQCTQDGRCTACSDNFQAPSCTGCVDGRYGDRCDMYCLSGCARCDRVSGDCTACSDSNLKFPGCTECVRGYYRQQTGHTCRICQVKCYNNTPCNNTSGHCQRCPPGKKGVTCNDACDGRMYGLDCALPCGHCQGGGACDPESGTCPLCQPGYYPPTCQNACRDKTYGQNCSESCGHCKGGQPCDTATGECTDGCQPGYNGSFCKAQCDAGLYGERCNETCGHCQVNTTCHHEDGHCLVGCVADFTGPLCSQAAVSGGSTGVVGGAVGGVLAAIVVIVAVVVVVCIIRRRRRREKPDDQRGAGAEMTGSTDPLTSAHRDDPSSPPQATTALSSAPVASMAPAANTNTKPQAEVKPTVKPGVKPGVKPKPHPPAKTNEAIYENVTISNQKPKPESSSEPKTANTKASPKLTGTKNEDAAKEKKGKPPVAVKPTKGRASRAGTETPPEPLADDEEEDFGPTDAIYGNEQLYGNIQPTGIRLDKLQDTVAKRLSDGSLEEEFMRMIPNKEFSLKNGQRDENYYKNRFNSILPYDKNRVELEQVDGDDASDYVNASFVRGYKTEKAYIAAQGPKVNTQDDFWRMVWQEGVAHIVMLTNVKEGNKPKCYEYWPAQGDRLTTGHMEVTGVEEETRAHFVIRTFDLKQTEGSEKRRVKQYHYQSWMDHEVPATTPLVNFWRYVRSCAPRTAQAPPLVVHCSAGVGRTGTFIALDIIYDQAQQEAEVNMYNTVDRLRDDRCHMVQNKNQYAFLHEAVVEAYMSGDSRIQMSDMDTVLPHTVTHHTPSDRIDKEFETLCKMRDNSTTPTYTTANLEENRAKNRNPKALPNDKHLVYLTQHVKGRNQYINAVYMSTFLQQRGSIMTQLPLPDTLVDFWRLVDGCDVDTIVSIGDVEGKKDMCRYWPKDSKSSVHAGAYNVSLKSMVSKGDCLDGYTVNMKKDGTSREVRVLHYKDWTGQVADNMADLVHLLTTLHTSHHDRGGKPVIVQCIDGASQSGVVCALWDVISRMTCDAELDGYMAVRQLHTVRPEALTSVEQYRYCYEVAQHFKNSYNVYANT